MVALVEGRIHWYHPFTVASGHTFLSGLTGGVLALLLVLFLRDASPALPGQLLARVQASPEVVVSPTQPTIPREGQGSRMPLPPRFIPRPLYEPKQPPLGETGPATLAAMAIGAAGGYALVRRRRNL